MTAIGQEKEYSSANVFQLRHMHKYIEQAANPNKLKPERIAELKTRVISVRKLAPKMYREAYILIQMIDGEQFVDIDKMWEHDLKMVQWRSPKNKFDYSDDELIHPFRHFDEYIKQIEEGNLSAQRVSELKNRLSIVMMYTVHAYEDATRIMDILYEQ